MPDQTVRTFDIDTFEKGQTHSRSDLLAIEEPLEISLAESGRPAQKVSITMRTPGNDAELALGFLFTEGIISRISQIAAVKHTSTLPGVESNTLEVTLAEGNQIPSEKLNRNFYTTSSCGVCGKASIDAIKTVSPFHNDQTLKTEINTEIITQLPEKLRNAQETFEKTGGLHASAIFDFQGNLLMLREDVGRHNALDKLIGRFFMDNKLPLNEHILLLSGRASFELIQKAAMAGIRIVAAVGAPSSLAVETAQSFGITLIGFLKENRFNVYHKS